MNLSAHKGRLNGLTKDLMLQWEDTRNYWRDTRSQEFHRRYILELLVRVEKTITVVEKLDELLRKVRSDCE